VKHFVSVRTLGDRGPSRRLGVAVGIVLLLAGLSSLAGAGNAAVATPSKTPHRVDFGAVCDLSGPFKSFGNTCQKTLGYAASQINHGQGIRVKGKLYTINFHFEDGASDPTRTVAAVRDLMSKNIKFLFGPETSVTSLQAAAAHAGTDVLHIGASSALHAALGTPGYKLTFDVIPQDVNWLGPTVNALQGLGIAKGGKVVVVYPDDTTGHAVVPTVTDLLKKGGYESDSVFFDSKTVDFAPIAAKVAGLHPAAVVMGYSLGVTLPLARALAQAKATPALLSVNATPTEIPKRIEQETGKPFPMKWGSILAGPNFSQPTTKRVARFAATVQSQLGLDHNSTSATFATWFYDYVYMMRAAMEKAQSVTDTKKIAAALRTIKCTTCVLGNLHFDKTQSAVFSTDIGFYVNGKETWKTIAPK
jgi:branched-chain amino acid transport system substrate-binding protein